jgi:hypothetical protein
MAKAGVYLTDEQMDELYEVRNILLEFNILISNMLWSGDEQEESTDLILNDPKYDRVDTLTNELSVAVNSAREVLEEEINEPIRNFEKS